MNTKRKVRITLDHIAEFPLGKHTLVPGVEVSIRGKRGRYRFQYASKTGAGLDVLTFVGGPLSGGHDEFTSVYPQRIRTVHRNNKTQYNIQKERASK